MTLNPPGFANNVARACFCAILRSCIFFLPCAESSIEDIPSSTAHVCAYIDEDNANNDGVRNTIYFNEHEEYPGLTLSGADDLWICRSTYIKWGVPGYSQDIPANRDYATLHYKIQIQGEGNVYQINPDEHSGVGRSRGSSDPRYGVGETEISALGVGFTGDNRHNTAASDGGYSINMWDSNAGAIPVGDGWYRVYTSILSPVSGVSSIDATTFPAGHDSLDPKGETSGAIYAFGEQLEVGRWPSELQINNNFRVTNWDFSGSVLNNDHCPGREEDKGTVRVVPPYGLSSYVPTNRLSSPPNPASTRVEDGNTDPLSASSTLSGFNMGQNLNVIPYRHQKDQLPVFFDALYNYVDNATSGVGMETLYQRAGASNPPSGTGSLGPQAYYLGCYPEGSSTGGSTFALVSSLDNSAAYLGLDDASSSPYYVHGTYNSIVNEASSMDVSGFINMVMSGSPGTTTGYAMSSTASGLCVSGGADITNSGMVEYSLLLGSGDVGYSNLYGGIFNMGLWTIDTEASRLAGNMPPYSFGPLDNPRKYKLFATKHLSRNLGYINDSGEEPGCLNYSDLTIKWRIHFT